LRINRITRPHCSFEAITNSRFPLPLILICRLLGLPVWFEGNMKLWEPLQTIILSMVVVKYSFQNGFLYFDELTKARKVK
jgi:hypothetical protein